ncbi:MFS transporter [Acinetobacter bouvetii]|uniref:Proline/betaine transporter n=1 Tax=Acinetobacter bouvetii TaxID=202951 RepID=A0A811GBE3_9GAMM|nr:MFS transporter [Acinetobacter bouvetii]CAB1217765.1 Proline/betaine transporter [Acinetobacter bouvetii]
MATAGNNKGIFKKILNVTSGNFLEQYDFFLFGFYASYIAAKFFHSENEYVSLMMTFTVFAAGFLMRPLGAIFLGAYVDKVGRRKGLIVTLSLMALGTLLITFVPSYDQIGIMAPILVVIGRLLQGFSAGVESGGVSIYLAEISTDKNRGFITSFQSGSQQIAVVFAAILGYSINVMLGPEQVGDWGWRIPFLIGCLIIPLIFILRRSLEETEAFKAQKTHPTGKEIFQTMLANWKVVLAGMLMSAMTTTTFYFTTVYTPTFAKRELDLTTSESLLAAVVVGLSNFIWLPIGGMISDRIGRKPVLVGITILAIFTAYPTLNWLVNDISFNHLIMALLYFSFFFGMYNGSMVATLAESMPVRVKTVGFSLAFSLATALFGGVTPMVSTFIIEKTGDASMPAIWLMFAATCSLLASLYLCKRLPNKKAVYQETKA